VKRKGKAGENAKEGGGRRRRGGGGRGGLEWVGGMGEEEGLGRGERGRGEVKEEGNVVGGNA